MENNQESLVVDQRNGNLHINIEGVFTDDTAAALTSTMVDSYRGKGNIFIHTAKVTKVMPESRKTFSTLLGVSGLPRDNVYLIGEKGKDIGHEKAKVIIRDKRKRGHGGCGGRCKNCTCHTRKAA